MLMSDALWLQRQTRALRVRHIACTTRPNAHEVPLGDDSYQTKIYSRSKSTESIGKLVIWTNTPSNDVGQNCASHGKKFH